MVIPYPDIDPVLIHLGPLSIRWYAISYITGLLLGWWFIVRMLSERKLWANPPFNGKAPATADDIGDLVVWATFGTIIGGRLGWDIIYGTILCSVSPEHAAFCTGLPMGFLTNPLKIIAAWEGGMSFHGGLLGVCVAVWLFTRKRGLNLLSIGDLCCAVAPFGLFFARIANFINGELWGRVTDVPWAMVFPRAGDGMPRHPSQLYEAALEGIVLFIILQIGIRVFHWLERRGLVSAIFFLGYGAFRFFVEFFREPDEKFLGPISMGMTLSLPMWIAGFALLWFALKTPKSAALPKT